MAEGREKAELEAALLGPLRLLRSAAFVSTFDRFTIAPMLVTIAAALGVSLEEVAVAASLYFLLYGMMQPVWGILSDRLGRELVMRLALLAVVVPGFLSALAPNLDRHGCGGTCCLPGPLAPRFRGAGDRRGNPWPRHRQPAARTAEGKYERRTCGTD